MLIGMSIDTRVEKTAYINRADAPTVFIEDMSIDPVRLSRILYHPDIAR
jgi:hypothetical protein